MRSVVFGIGSNLGDSASILQGAVSDLNAIDGLEITAASTLYETDPIGGPQQGVFLNAVLLGRTTLDNAALLDAAQSVEQDWHRVREVRWGPRTLDVDVLAIDDEVSDDPRLTIPHPRAHERAFVLVPWLEVDPQARVAGHGAVADLLDDVDASGVRRTDRQLVIASRTSRP